MVTLKGQAWKPLSVLVGLVVVLGGLRLALEEQKLSLAPDIVPVLAGQRFSGPPPNPQGAAYVVDFRRLAPDQWPGTTRIITNGGLSEAATVRDGMLRQGHSLTTIAATYFERRFPADVFRIGITVNFPNSATGDPGVAMIIADGPLPDFTSANPKRPNAAVHFVATRKGWEATVWPSGGTPDRIAADAFNADTFPGPLRFEIRRVGGSLQIISPDGTTVKVEDERVAKLAGPFACWELFQQGKGLESAAITELWAQ